MNLPIADTEEGKKIYRGRYSLRSLGTNLRNQGAAIIFGFCCWNYMVGSMLNRRSWNSEII